MSEEIFTRWVDPTIEEKDKEIERLNKENEQLRTALNTKESIIKEVREYIGISEELRKICTNYDVNGIDILEILDKVGVDKD